MYVDGNLQNAFGNTGANGKPFKEFSPLYQFPVPFNIERGNEHTVAVHFVDFISPLPPYHLKSQKHSHDFYNNFEVQNRTFQLLYARAFLQSNVDICKRYTMPPILVTGFSKSGRKKPFAYSYNYITPFPCRLLRNVCQSWHFIFCTWFFRNGSIYIKICCFDIDHSADTPDIQTENNLAF